MGALLAALPGLIPVLLPVLVPQLAGVLDKYLNKQITKDQLEAEVRKALLDAFSQIDVAEAESIAKTYTAFMAAAAQNKILSWGWLIAVVWELVMITWFQFGIPAVVYFYGHPWPSSGNTAEWSYGLLVLTLGGGAAMLRTGPTDGANIITKLRSLVGIK